MSNNYPLVETLQLCAISCRRCTEVCLKDGEVKKVARCIKLCLDCSITTLAEKLVIRSSEVLNEFLEVCAAICRLCAEECIRHASHLPYCGECAEVCKKCEDICLYMA